MPPACPLVKLTHFCYRIGRTLEGNFIVYIGLFVGVRIPEARTTIHATKWSDANQAQDNLESVRTMGFSHVIAIAIRTKESIAINDHVRRNAVPRLIAFSPDSLCLRTLLLGDVAHHQ
jgi:hypothetical protein